MRAERNGGLRVVIFPPTDLGELSEVRMMLEVPALTGEARE